MAVFRSFRLDAYFLTIIAGIYNTERVASDFSNVYTPPQLRTGMSGKKKLNGQPTNQPTNRHSKFLVLMLRNM